MDLHHRSFIKTSGSDSRVYSDSEGLTAVSAPTVNGKVNASPAIYEANVGVGELRNLRCGDKWLEVSSHTDVTVTESVWLVYPGVCRNHQLFTEHDCLQIGKDVSLCLLSNFRRNCWKIKWMQSLRRLVPELQKIPREI